MVTRKRVPIVESSSTSTSEQIKEKLLRKTPGNYTRGLYSLGWKGHECNHCPPGQGQYFNSRKALKLHKKQRHAY